MSFNVAVETIVFTNKQGGEKRSSIAHVIMPFDKKEDADSFISNYDAYENPKEWIQIYRTATRLY